MSTVKLAGTRRELTRSFEDLLGRLDQWGSAAGDEPDDASIGRTLTCSHGRHADVNLVIDRPSFDDRLEAHIVAAFGKGRECNCSKALSLEVQRTPFTDTEMNELRALMPLTSSSAEWIDDPDDPGGPEPLSGYAAIFTIHHQRDFLVLLEELLHRGLDPADVLVVDKEYEYEYRERVDGHLRYKVGVGVTRFSELDESLALVFRRIQQPEVWKRVILIDDGGYLYPRARAIVPDELDIKQFVLGIVEQTSSGILALRPFLPDDLRVPLFNVAESDLKSTVEARGVARAALRSLRRALEDVHWGGRRAVVAGFGRIGHALAEELRREDVVTAVFDTSPASLVGAREDGFQTFETLVDAMKIWQPHLIFGCTGRAHFADDIVENLNQNCFAVSTTSRDYEFDVPRLRELAVHADRLSWGTTFTYERRNQKWQLHLVADGYPVNFFHAESMPNEQSDLVMASMLLGAVELVRRQDKLAETTNKEETNEILNQHDILREYYRIRSGVPGLATSADA